MENIPVTTYRGFSAVSGETTFTQDMADIKNGKHAKLIIKIASLVAQGKVEEANHVKKQLPFRTLTANYRERRLAPSITRYNPVITLDIDDLEERQLEQTRTLINEDPHTLGSFLSPKRHGYKLFVFMQTEYTRRLYDRLRQGEVTYATLEEIHLKLYSAAKEHYEALLGVEVDGSGKDISRGYFMSFDPHAYINAALLEQISPLPARIIPPAKKENSPKKTPVETVHPLPASSAATPQDAKPWEKLIFSQAVTAVKRTTRFRAGNRDNFLFALGNKCYSKGLDEQTAIRLAKNEFGQEYPDVESPLHNAYIYTDKTSEAATKKEEKKPVINQVMSFLEEHYGIRRNLILDRLEFMPYTPSADAGKGYRPMRGKDYIAQLADTLTTENRELWQKGFKRWIVGLVACALSDEDMNQLVIILYSEQGKGKSSWIRRLLPPEWKEYFYNGIIDPSNKDDARLLATRIIINMEEFEGVKPGELAALKRIIAQDNVTQRKAYDIEAFTLPRHCSFIASTNNRQCLQDIGGNRRFLPITITGIDYHTPVNHPGIYAQAIALLKDGFRYWYEGEEIEQLNKHNERHRMKDPVEENLFVFFRKPLPEDLQVKWLPASVILTKLSIFGKVQVNPHTQLVLVQALEKYGFGTRTNEQETTEYEVVDIQLYQ